MSKLSAVAVRNAKPKNKPYKLSDGKGLYLHIATSGKRTWRYRFKLAGKESTVVLGEYPAMSLEESRIERVEAREMVKAGKNPAQIRKEEKRAEIIKTEAAKLSNKNTIIPKINM